MLFLNRYTPQELFFELKKYFKDLVFEEQIWWIIEHVLSKNKVTIITQDLIELYEKDKIILEKIKKDLLEKKPIQYILGYTEFCNLKIITKEPILIPRPETEEWIINFVDNKNIKPKNILDIGTGTGCIALALKYYYPNSKVSAVDINPQAINLAKENAQLNNIDINFIVSDLFENINQKEKFDLIVSNPPYISEDEYNKLDDSVKNFEDKNALIANDNGTEIVKKIIIQAKNFLTKDGFLAIETDRNQEYLVDFARNNGWKNANYKKDFNNQNRVLILSN